MPRNWLLEAAIERRAREDVAKKNADVRPDHAPGRNANPVAVLRGARCAGCGKELRRNYRYDVCRTCRGPSAE